MKSSRIIWAVIIILIVAGGWYLWSSMKSASPAPAPAASATPSPSAPLSKPVLFSITGAKLGKILVAVNGLTLYRYTKDTPGVSNCSGTCATNWPPYTVSASDRLVAAPGLYGQLATIKRADGTLQLTYNGSPLYFWHGDKLPGNTLGQNVGGVWFVVTP